MLKYVYDLFHNKFRMLGCNSSLVITTKVNLNRNFALFYIAILCSRDDACFSPTRKISGPYIKQCRAYLTTSRESHVGIIDVTMKAGGPQSHVVYVSRKSRNIKIPKYRKLI
jgi:hypothetical protein